MATIVDIPGHGEVEFPDSMSPDDINSAAKRLYEEAQPKPAASPSMGDKALAFGVGLGRGVTMGWGDELAAGVAAPFRALSDGKGLGEAYRTERDENRAINKQVADRAPSAAMVGDIAGSVATPIPFGKAKAAGTLGKLGLAAARAGVQGAVRGAGESESSADNVPQWLMDVGGDAVGAGLTSAATAGALGASGRTLGWLGDKTKAGAKELARGLALRAAGGERGSLGKILRGPNGERKLNYMADMILGGKGLDGKKMMRVGDRAQDVAKRFRDTTAETGRRIGEARDQAAAAGAKVDIGKVSDEVLAGASDVATRGTKGASTANRALAEAAQLERHMASKGGSLSEAASEATRMGKEIAESGGYLKIDPAASSNMLGQKMVQRALAKQRDAAVASRLTPGEMAAYSEVMKIHGRASEVAKLGSDKAAREAGNLPFGIMEGQGFQSGSGGGRTMTDLAAGAVGALATRLSKTRGGSTAAIMLDKIARMKFPPAAAQALEDAAQFGPAAVLAVYFEMSKSSSLSSE